MYTSSLTFASFVEKSHKIKKKSKDDIEQIRSRKHLLTLNTIDLIEIVAALVSKRFWTSKKEAILSFVTKFGNSKSTPSVVLIFGFPTYLEQVKNMEFHQ